MFDSETETGHCCKLWPVSVVCVPARYAGRVIDTFSFTLDTSQCRVNSSLHTVKTRIQRGVFRKVPSVRRKHLRVERPVGIRSFMSRDIPFSACTSHGVNEFFVPGSLWGAWDTEEAPDGTVGIHQELPVVDASGARGGVDACLKTTMVRAARTDHCTPPVAQASTLLTRDGRTGDRHVAVSESRHPLRIQAVTTIGQPHRRRPAVLFGQTQIPWREHAGRQATWAGTCCGYRALCAALFMTPPPHVYGCFPAI